MRRFRAMLHRLRGLFRRRAIEAEMNAELQAHLDGLTERHRAAGLSPEDARCAARREFGGVAQVAELARDQRRSVWVEQWWQDLRYAARSLRKTPIFTAVATFSLALGIGANTAVFSLVNAVLLQMLPVKSPEQLVLFNWLAEENVEPDHLSGAKTREPGSNQYTCTSFSLTALEAFRVNAPTLSDVFGFVPVGRFNVIAEGSAEGVGGQFASHDYHRGFGVGATAGRLITADDDRPDAEAVAVISYRYWQRRFGGDPRAIGKVIVINESPVTVIGVTAPGFNGAGQVGQVVDVTLPLVLLPRFVRVGHGLQPNNWFLRIMGRMKPGATLEQTRASLEGVFQGTARDQLEVSTLPGAPAIDPAKVPLPQLRALPGGQGLYEARREYEHTLLLLMGTVALVLLVACANVASLLLARGNARRREFAVRLALGAGRARVVRQLLAESVLLASLGGFAGLMLAWWGARTLLALRPFGSGLLQIDTPLDWRVLGFTSAVALATGIVFGLAPALRSTRLNLTEEFQGGARSLGGSRSTLAHSMMVGQVALSLVLLVGAGLFVRTLRNLHRVDVGFNRESLLLFEIDAATGRRRLLNAITTLDPIRERIATLPGVRRATYANDPPLAGSVGWQVYVPGYVPTTMNEGVGRYDVDSSYLATLEIPLLRGRNFDLRDYREGAPKVAIVNQVFAKKYFGTEEDAVGKRIGLGLAKEATVEIIGLTRDARFSGVKGEVPPVALVPYDRTPMSFFADFIVRFSGSEAAVVAGVRAAIREIDPNLPVTNMRTQVEQIDRLFSRERFFATLGSFFGVLALLLTAVGLYGLISYQVLRRTGEIGVRMALGALPRSVLGMIVGESLVLTGLGVIVGLAAAIGVTRVISGMLYGVLPVDPLTYGVVAVTLLAVASAAALLPAWRAAKIDPVVALRKE